MSNENELIINHLSRAKKRTLRSVFKENAEEMTVGGFFEAAAKSPRNSRIRSIIADYNKNVGQVEPEPIPPADLDLDFPVIRLFPPEQRTGNRMNQSLEGFTAEQILRDDSRARARIKARELCVEYIRNYGHINGHPTVKGIAHIPSNPNSAAPLFSRLENLIKEAISLSEGNDNANRLNLKYFEKQPIDGVTYETVRTSINKYIDNLKSGETIEGHPDFVVDTSIFSELENHLQEYCGRRVSDFEHAIGCPEGELAESFLKVFIKNLGYDISNSQNADNLICKTGSVGATNRLYSRLDNILCSSILPILYDELISRVLEDEYAIERIEDLQSEVNRWIENNPDVIVSEQGLCYTGSALKSDEHRVARLLNKLQTPITDDKLIAIFMTQYNREPKRPLDLHKLTKLGCRRGRNGVWHFASETVSLLAMVEKYVDDVEGTFTLEDITKALGDICQFYDEKTIRSYITNFCRVSNDRKLFCPIDMVEDFPDVEWRKKSDHDQTHYYLTALINLLSENADSMAMTDCIEALRARGNADGYNTRNIKAIIQKYANPSTKDHFLEIKNEIVSLIFDRLADLDMMTIGRGGEYINEVIPIVSYTFQILNDKGNITFTELAKLINKNVNPNISRTSIQRLLIKYGTEFELKKVNGNILVSFQGNHRFIAEPKYEIQESGNKQHVVAKRDTNPRIELSPVALDWDILKSLAVQELNYHARTNKFGKEFNLKKAVANYFNFIQGSTNKLLSERIPFGLHRYMLGATNSYERYSILQDIILGFEGMLQDFLPRNNVEKKRTSGLSELMYIHYYDLYLMLSNNKWQHGLPMGQTLSDLIHKRNLLAHGIYLNLTSAQTALCMANFLALTVFAFNKISQYYA